MGISCEQRKLRGKIKFASISPIKRWVNPTSHNTVCAALHIQVQNYSIPISCFQCYVGINPVLFGDVSRKAGTRKRTNWSMDRLGDKGSFSTAGIQARCNSTLHYLWVMEGSSSLHIALCRVPFLPCLVSRQDLIGQEKQPCITQLRHFAQLAPEVKLGVTMGHHSRAGAHLDFHL